MQNKLLISAVAILILLGGVIFVWQKNLQQNAQTLSMVKTEDKGDKTAQQNEYPQHIEAISGNADEVWYSIPELGVRMKLNKEFAEDLIYIQDDPSVVYFSTKKLSQISPCLPIDGPFGSLFKAKGDMKEIAKTDEYTAARVSGYIQIGQYYYGWIGPQEVCWDLEGKLNNVFPIEYKGNGSKTVSEAVKTLEVLK
jgi:hypothetical protein